MSPLLVLLGGGAALFLLMKSGKSGAPGTTDTAGVKIPIKGPSGIQWIIEHYTDMNAGYVYTKVTMPNAQFGAQGETPMFTYATPIGKVEPNSLVSLNSEAPRTLFDKAVSDFNVTVPAGIELPES
jgi:hypothetical protein